MATHAQSHVLVLGGTGILRPAADALAEQGWKVSVAARGGRAAGAGQRLVAVDGHDAEALAAALDADVAAAGPYAAALVYAPALGEAGLAAVAARTPGTLVDVLTSAWDAPQADRAARERRARVAGPAAVRQLLLGWSAAAPVVRWHTPEEVSAAALTALADDAAARATLGTTRPWSARPA